MRNGRLPVRYEVEILNTGTIVHGDTDLRQSIICDVRVVMHVDTTIDLHLDMIPNIVQYAFTDDSFALLVPILFAEYAETPIRPSQFPVLHAALRTGEIELRIVTPNEDRTLRASDVLSSRWSGAIDEVEAPAPALRPRLVLPVGRDRAMSVHPGGVRVMTIHNDPDANSVVRLRNLIIPERSTCIVCDLPKPDSREHVVPDWARRVGDRGVTVASCGPCNRGLSQLEEAVCEFHRAGTMPAGGEYIVTMWAVKTM